MRTVLLLLYSILHLALIQASAQPPPPLSCKVGVATPADTPCAATQKGCSLTIETIAAVITQTHACITAEPTADKCAHDAVGKKVVCECKTEKCNSLATFLTADPLKKQLVDELKKIELVVNAANGLEKGIKCLDAKRSFTEKADGNVDYNDSNNPDKLCEAGQVCQVAVKSKSLTEVEAVSSCGTDGTPPIAAPVCSHVKATKEIVCKCNKNLCNDEKEATLKTILDGVLGQIDVKRVPAKPNQPVSTYLINAKRSCLVSDAAGVKASKECLPTERACKIEISLVENADKTFSTKEVYSCATSAKDFSCKSEKEKITCECDTNDCNSLTKIEADTNHLPKLRVMLNTGFKDFALGLLSGAIASVHQCKYSLLEYGTTGKLLSNTPQRNVFCGVKEICTASVFRTPAVVGNPAANPPIKAEPERLYTTSNCVIDAGGQSTETVCRMVSQGMIACDCRGDFCNDLGAGQSPFKNKLRNEIYKIKIAMAANGTLTDDASAVAPTLQCKTGDSANQETVPCIEGQCTYTAGIDGANVKESFACVDGPKEDAYKCTNDAAGKKVVCACSRDGICNRAGYVKLAREFKEEAFKVGILVNDTYYLSVAPTTTPQPTTTTTVEVFYEDNAEDLMEDENSAALMSIGCALLLTALFV